MKEKTIIILILTFILITPAVIAAAGNCSDFDGDESGCTLEGCNIDDCRWCTASQECIPSDKCDLECPQFPTPNPTCGEDLFSDGTCIPEFTNVTGVVALIVALLGGLLLFRKL